jgi:hypothetical protein
MSRLDQRLMAAQLPRERESCSSKGTDFEENSVPLPLSGRVIRGGCCGAKTTPGEQLRNT